MLDKIPQLCIEIDALAAFGSIRSCEPWPRSVLSVLRRRGRAVWHRLGGCRRKALEHCRPMPGDPAAYRRLPTGRTERRHGDTLLLLLDEPWIADILRFRIDSTRRFLVEVRKRIDAVRQNVRLSVAFVPPVKAGHDALQPRPWLAAQSYAAYKDAAELIHCVVHWNADVVEYDTLARSTLSREALRRLRPISVATAPPGRRNFPACSARSTRRGRRDRLLLLRSDVAGVLDAAQQIGKR